VLGVTIWRFGSQPHASWYADFARNAITFAYTDKKARLAQEAQSAREVIERALTALRGDEKSARVRDKTRPMGPKLSHRYACQGLQ
jgi:hypothetical protein